MENEKMNEFEAKDYILTKGRDIKTAEELVELIKEVETNFNYDYGVAPRTIGAVAAVVAKYLSGTMGITGFQAGCAMWNFIISYHMASNKCGLKLVDWDEMLYPQYQYKYEKTINRRTWKALQKEAANNLGRSGDYASPEVVEHWQSIVDGKVPFGYVVVDD